MTKEEAWEEPCRRPKQHTMAVMQPVIVTEGTPYGDPRLLAFALASLWPGDEYARLRDRLAHDLAERVRGCSYSELMALIKKHRPDDIDRLRAHQEQALVSRSAYVPSQRENPNAVFWPNPSAPTPHGRSIYGELPYAHQHRILSKQSRIGSAGSCFAIEIKKYLTANGYNYIETEPNEFGSANWGGQYNALAFLQTVEWAFGLRERPLFVWKSTDTGREEYWDPFRDGVFYNEPDGIGPSWQAHRAAARQSLSSVDYFVLTLGLTEIWRTAFSDDVLARFPRTMAAHLVRAEVLSVEQNIAALERALEILRQANPNVTMIVTVSPVPLYATFQGDDKHVVVATQLAKSILRVALDQLAARHPNAVIYFPAFEVVMWCTERPWQPDMRHVSPEAVANVMRLFERMMLV